MAPVKTTPHKSGGHQRYVPEKSKNPARFQPELEGGDEVSAADMDAAEQAHRQALAAFAQAEAERVNALDVERSDIEAAMADVFSPEIAASIAARIV